MFSIHRFHAIYDNYVSQPVMKPVSRMSWIYRLLQLNDLSKLCEDSLHSRKSPKESQQRTTEILQWQIYRKRYWKCSMTCPVFNYTLQVAILFSWFPQSKIFTINPQLQTHLWVQRCAVHVKSSLFPQSNLMSNFRLSLDPDCLCFTKICAKQLPSFAKFLRLEHQTLINELDKILEAFQCRSYPLNRLQRHLCCESHFNMSNEHSSHDELYFS